MRIIDLLNKIANGEELPKKIKFNHIEYHLIDDYYVDDVGSDLFIYIFKNNIDFSVNDEIEILEDEEKGLPEKLIPTSLKGIDNLDEKIEIAHIDTISVIDTVNLIIDYLEKQRKGE